MKTLYRILLAMALVASATLFAPTSPAHALLAKRELCLDLNGDGRFDKYECIPIDITWRRVILGCLRSRRSAHLPDPHHY